MERVVAEAAREPGMQVVPLEHAPLAAAAAARQAGGAMMRRGRDALGAEYK